MPSAEESRLESHVQVLRRMMEGILSSSETMEVLQAAADALVPAMADYCVLELMGDDHKIHTALRRHASAQKQQVLDEYSLRFTPQENLLNPTLQAIASRQPLLVEVAPDSLVAQMAPTAEARRLFMELDPRSFLVIPLMAHRRSWGALTLVYSDSNRRFSRQDMESGIEIGRWIACALERITALTQASEATRAREHVLHVVSHELRTPLAAITLAATTLAQEGASAKRVETIHRAVERMDGIIQGLLDFGLLDAKKLQLRLRETNVQFLIDEAVHLTRPLADARNQELQIQNLAGPLAISCDPDRIVQVLVNLIGNAIKFSPTGKPIIIRAAPRGLDVDFFVQDFGPGIPREQQAKVFDLFWRDRNSEAIGTGIGLAVSKGLVEAHGGRIWVDSTPGSGSTFCFSIPIGHELPSVGIRPRA